MTDTGDPIADLVPITGSYDYELQLIREAIAMVSTGKAPRVVVAGIRYAAILFDPAERLAQKSGIGLTPLRRKGVVGFDISVERVDG